MTKYIELEALKNRFAKRLVWLKKDIHDEYSLGLHDGCEYDTKLIDEIPTADVAPVRHGEWEIVVGSNGKEYMVCGTKSYQVLPGDKITQSVNHWRTTAQLRSKDGRRC